MGRGKELLCLDLKSVWCIKSEETYMRRGSIYFNHSISTFPKNLDLGRVTVGLIQRLEVNYSNVSLLNLDPKGDPA